MDLKKKKKLPEDFHGRGERRRRRKTQKILNESFDSKKPTWLVLEETGRMTN